MKKTKSNAPTYNSKDEWKTPDTFFALLDEEFDFTLDPCSTDENAKCEKHFTEKENGLLQDWGGNVVFCNPPCTAIDKWIQKCYEESQKDNTVVVALLPVRTDTKRFHDYIVGKAEIRFLKGRLKFSGSTGAAPFASMVAIWRSEDKGQNDTMTSM